MFRGVLDKFNEINDRESIFEKNSRNEEEVLRATSQKGLIAYRRMTANSRVLSSSRCQKTLEYLYTAEIK